MSNQRSGMQNRRVRERERGTGMPLPSTLNEKSSVQKKTQTCSTAAHTEKGDGKLDIVPTWVVFLPPSSAECPCTCFFSFQSAPSLSLCYCCSTITYLARRTTGCFFFFVCITRCAAVCTLCVVNFLVREFPTIAACTFSGVAFPTH